MTDGHLARVVFLTDSALEEGISKVCRTWSCVLFPPVFPVTGLVHVSVW